MANAMATRQATRTTPARPAKTTIVTETVCDVCGKGQTGRSLFYVCEICGRDVCPKHAVLIYTSEDYPNTYCSHCRELCEKYLKQLEALERECDEKEERIREVWKRESLSKGNHI